MIRIFKRSLFSVSLLIYLVSSSSLWADIDVNKEYYSDPQAIINDINKRGADAVVSTFFENEEDWDFIMEKIASGNNDWIQVSVALRPGTDGHATETMGLALGEALTVNPEKVLYLFSDEIWLKLICSFPDIHDAKYNTKDKTLNEMDKRHQIISAISTPELKLIRDKCIKHLEKAKIDISKWFDDQN